MLKKNLIGIMIVGLVFVGFYAGYVLGKNAGGSATSGMRPGAANSDSRSLSSRPRSQGQEAIQQEQKTQPTGGNELWVAPQNTEQGTSASSSHLVNVAWAESLEASPSVPQQHAPEQQVVSESSAIHQDDPVKEAAVVTQETTAVQTFYGTVTPHTEANVQSKQGGTITLLKGKEGDAVRQGDVIVRFDDREAQLELQQAIASKNSALQQVNQAESNFQTIQSNVNRYQQLFKDGFVSKQQVDDLQNQLASATSSLNSAKESVNQTDVQIKMIQNALKDFQVNAPMSGLIDAKNYNLGEVYQGGAVIYHVINIDQVYVEVEIPETYLKHIREGMSVTVIFDALGEDAFAGTLETILPSGAADNRNFTANVLVDNRDHSIKPGMFARIEMPL